MVTVHILIEGSTDSIVIRKILQSFSAYIQIGTELGLKGKMYIRDNVNRYHQASRTSPFLCFCFVDLDDDDCPVQLVREWLNADIGNNFIFRVVVHEIEAWLLADRVNLAQFMGVPMNFIPLYPDQILRPKELLVDIARRSSHRELRTFMVPAPNSTSKVGKAYLDAITRFVAYDWNIEEARKNSPSLSRTLSAIERFVNERL